MFYLNKNDFTDYISGDAFIACGNKKRKELLEKYQPMGVEDMIMVMNAANSWDSIDPRMYDELADTIGRDINEFFDMEDLLDAAEEYLSKGE